MSSFERPSSSLDWNVRCDPAIAAAVERQAELYRQWRSAQAQVQAAERAIAEARDADEQRRATALADGEAGPGSRSLAKVEQAAEKAAERRDVLQRAFVMARAKALEVADEREGAWRAAAAARVDESREAMRTLIEQLEGTYAAFAEAWVELALAENPDGRGRGQRKIAAGVPTPPLTIDEWRQLGSSCTLAGV